jgi:hypothetical protein
MADKNTQNLTLTTVFCVLLLFLIFPITISSLYYYTQITKGTITSITFTMDSRYDGPVYAYRFTKPAIIDQFKQALEARTIDPRPATYQHMGYITISYSRGWAEEFGVFSTWEHGYYDGVLQRIDLRELKKALLAHGAQPSQWE